MYDTLGLVPKDDLLSFGEINALSHSEDIDLFDLAARLADR